MRRCLGGRRVYVSPVHAQSNSGIGPGLEVSLGGILENLLLQRQLRHPSLELCVLTLQFLQSFRFTQVQAAIFLRLAVVGLYRDLCFLAGLRRGLSVRNIYFNLTQQRDDLFLPYMP